MLGDILTELFHHGDDERIELALFHAGGFDVHRLGKHLLQQAFRHHRADAVLATGEQHRLRRAGAGRLRHGLRPLFLAHDPVRKPISTFWDHAPLSPSSAERRSA
jgi:hypothetical protein